MDKLQPLIQNRFWILAGLVLPLSMYGYYSANGALKAETEKREGELDSVKSGISQGFEPNDDYKEKLAYINDYYEVAVNEAIVELWEHQQDRMEWPPTVQGRVPEEFMGEFDLNTRFTYKGLYEDLIDQLRLRFQPVAPLTMQDEVNWKQKVVMTADVPQAQFGSLGITSQDMWDAQIDIWLVRLLADAVAKINEDKDSVTEAVLRRIDRLELHGGDGQPTSIGGATSAGGGDYGEDMYSDMGMSGERGESKAGSVTSSVSFDPAEVFGSSGAGGGRGDYADDSEMMMSGGGSSAGPAMRYIAEDETAPYFERGFYMSVIIMQKKIPDFIVELANSDWPVRIERFHIGNNPHRSERPRSRSGQFSRESSGFEDFEGYEGSMGQGYEESFSGSRLGGRGSAKTVNPYASGHPEFAAAAMNHPDLVQLDLAGVITIYREPTETIAALEEAREQMAAATAIDPGTPEPVDTLPGTPEMLDEQAIEETSEATGELPATPLPDSEIPETAEEAEEIPPATAAEAADESDEAASPDPSDSDPSSTEPPVEEVPASAAATES